MLQPRSYRNCNSICTYAIIDPHLIGVFDLLPWKGVLDTTFISQISSVTSHFRYFLNFGQEKFKCFQPLLHSSQFRLIPYLSGAHPRFADWPMFLSLTSSDVIVLSSIYLFMTFCVFIINRGVPMFMDLVESSNPRKCMCVI